MKRSSDATLLVNSCDKYEDCWDPFFTLLKKYWDPEYPIVLNTEGKTYTYPGLDIRTLQLYAHGENPEWSERLISTLKQIGSEFVLFMLDDFFLESSVDTEQIEQSIQWMREDPEIAAISFMPILSEGNLPCAYPGFEQRPENGEYRLNCQAAVWRREALLKNLRPHESAWLFETLGSRRNSRRYKDQKFYAAKADNTVMQYHYEVGAALHRGRWNPYMKEFAEKEGLQIDFSVRGYNEDISGSAASNRKYILQRLTPKRIIRAIINRWRSWR